MAHNSSRDMYLLSVVVFSLFKSFSYSQSFNGDSLFSPNRLDGGQCLHSSSGQYSLCYQLDAHLVGYDCLGVPFWANNNYNYIVGYCIMQNDGNFVCYDSNNAPKWSTGTAGQGVGPYKLKIQNDRNIVLYDSTLKALWNSNTVHVNSLLCPSSMPSFSPTTPSAGPSSIPHALPTSLPSVSPPITSTSSPTSSPSSVPSALPSIAPTTPSSVIPYSPIFTFLSFIFDGTHFEWYSSLHQVIAGSFTFSVWVKTSTYPAVIVSLGRSASSIDGEFIIELDESGRLHYWDSSLRNGTGFNAHSVEMVATGTNIRAVEKT